MTAKGGHVELSDAEVVAAVDYMLARSGYDPAALPAASVAKREEAAPSAPTRSGQVDDKTITERIAEALRRDVAPGANIETYAGVTIVGGTGVRIETRAGVVILRGMVNSAEVVERAESIARAADGVRIVDNKLVSSAVFE